jgi:hypothetical protein
VRSRVDQRLAAGAKAYVRFGLAQPETYRLIFMEDPKLTTALFGEGQDDAGARAFPFLVEPLEELKAAGRLAADADSRQLAEVLWAGIHGIVSLKLTCAGFWGTEADVLTSTLLTTFFHGLPGLTGAQRPST